MHINLAFTASILGFIAGASAWIVDDSHSLAARDAVVEENSGHLFERGINQGIFSRGAENNLNADNNDFYPRDLGQFDTEAGDNLVRRNDPAKTPGKIAGSATSPEALSAKRQVESTRVEARSNEVDPSQSGSSRRRRPGSSVRSMIRNRLGNGEEGQGSSSGGFRQRFNAAIEQRRFGAGGLENGRSFAAANARYDLQQQASQRENTAGEGPAMGHPSAGAYGAGSGSGIKPGKKGQGGGSARH